MFSAYDFSPRASSVTLRTYSRPQDEFGSSFEGWEQIVKRSMFDHHLRLWEEAGGSPDVAELNELMQLGLERKSLVAGRTLWLGGTEYAFSRACCQFNCSWTPIKTVYDLVDASWLLLNGSGVGARPEVGVLHGYPNHVKSFSTIDTTNSRNHKGDPKNLEIPPTENNHYTWMIQVGDSAEAWAKAIGKLHLHPYQRIDHIIIDGSNCRGPGGRLKGYGWLCNGFAPLAKALEGMHTTLNAKAGCLLDELDIMDNFNRVGEVLSSRRAAEAVLMDAGNPMAESFSTGS